MTKKMYLFVEIREGILGDVVPCKTMDEAKDAFKKAHGLDFDKVMDRDSEESAQFDAEGHTSDIVEIVVPE